MSDQAQKDNLARIRDNQRRSRARRKEYLQELEARYRNCEQLGVEASAEIQAAAKRVLEENKRLRALLRQKGVSDAEIDSFTEHYNSSASTSAQQLNAMLQTRKPCNGQHGCGKPPEPVAIPRITVGTCIQPSQQPPCTELPGRRTSSLSTVSTISVPSPMSASSTIPSPVSGATPMPQFSVGDPGNPTVMYESSNQYPAFTYYGMPMQNPWPSYSNLPMTNGTIALHTANNTSSCVYAANIIRDTQNDGGPELEQDLGCSGMEQDCKAENSVVFDVMDKYSAQSMGL